MGPNGRGKSTLAYTLMGHPKYTVDKGEAIYKGQNVLELAPDERAKLGLFLSFQYPQEIPGVSVSNFLRTAYKSLNGHSLDKKEDPKSFKEFQDILKAKMDLLKMDESFARRFHNKASSRKSEDKVG